MWWIKLLVLLPALTNLDNICRRCSFDLCPCFWSPTTSKQPTRLLFLVLQLHFLLVLQPHWQWFGPLSSLLNLYRRPHMFYLVRLQKQLFISLNLISFIHVIKKTKTKTKPKKRWCFVSFVSWPFSSRHINACIGKMVHFFVSDQKNHSFRPKNIFLNFITQTVGNFCVGWMACLLCNFCSKCSSLVLQFAFFTLKTKNILFENFPLSDEANSWWSNNIYPLRHWFWS